MLQLAPKVFMAQVRERAVILDLVRDRYMALNPRMTRAALALTGACPDGADLRDLEAARATLTASGLLVQAEAPTGPEVAIVPAPAFTLWPAAPTETRMPLSRAAAILLTLTQTWLTLRRRPFAETVAWVQTQRPRMARRPRSDQQLLDEFFAVRPWFPIKPICRLDAVALALHFRRSGRPADLVFGVRLDPFRAHCWVQNTERVINEPHDNVARFTPILAV